ncbi:beta-lactamase-like protein [Tribonema minus]|uniref:ribonuclease Z n=1 Tax=Tribonema minus TaxID=303371 RepID=A0A836CGF5_9STRA|nr:beta-lactamase-like protein [Tribonema minus]
MAAYVQLVSCGTPDSSPCVVVATEHERHLFNVGEGCQRLCMEHKVRLTKAHNMYLTHIAADTVGGLPGMLLTLADTGKTGVNLHGPQGLVSLLHATRHFMSRPGFAVHAMEGPGTSTSKGLLVDKLLIGGTAAEHRRHTDTKADKPASAGGREEQQHDHPDLRYPRSAPYQQACLQQQHALPAHHHHKQDVRPPPWRERPAGPSAPARCMCYIARTPSVAGKFNVARAVELGVPKGPLFGQLKSGQTVTLSDGTSVTPDQVVAPSIPGGAVAIVSCPTQELVESLIAHSGWDPWRSGGGAVSQAGGGSNAGIANGIVGGGIDCALSSSHAGGSGTSGDGDRGCGASSGAGAGSGGGDGGGGGNGSGVSDGALSLHVMVHLAPAEVVTSPDYRAWCEGFGAAVCHIVAAQRLCHQHMAFQAALRQCQKLNRCCEDIFPLPHQFAGPADAGDQPMTDLNGTVTDSAVADSAVTGVAVTGATGTEASQGLEPVVLSGVEAAHAGVPLLRYCLFPPHKQGLDLTEALTFASAAAEQRQQLADAWSLAQEAGVEGHLQAAAAARSAAELATAAAAADSSAQHGSAQPSKYRNVSGIYLRVAAEGGRHAGMLMDCGEGTMGQIWRLYGTPDEVAQSGSGAAGSAPHGAAEVLTSLRAVWISHPHADHHLGLLRLLAERARYAAIDGAIANGYVFVDCADLESPGATHAALRSGLGLAECWNARVVHCSNAYALIMRSVQGWKLVYSGDTRPCEALVQAGMGATVLIHEATFEDAKQQDAVDKKHSTVSEALDVAQRMGAHRTILTHFSQRYPKLPVLPPSCYGADATALIAFDYMRVPLPALSWLPQMLPALQCMFPAVEEKDDNDAEDGASVAL